MIFWVERGTLRSRDSTRRDLRSTEESRNGDGDVKTYVWNGVQLFGYVDLLRGSTPDGSKSVLT